MTDKNVLPDDDEPKTWQELAEAAIADLRHYADDVLPYRRLVSAEFYEKRAELLKNTDCYASAFRSALS